MPAVSSSKSINTKIQHIEAPTEALVVSSGAQLVLESGATLFIGGSDLTSTAGGVANAVAGAASGYKIARGETSVTGLTGGDVDTGLTTVVAVIASLAEDAALTGMWVTGALGAGSHITLKVWKPTATGDCTPILATAAKKVDWIAIGT